MRLMLRGVFDEVDDFRDGALAEALGYASLDYAADVDAARDNLVSDSDFAGHALAGEGDGVQRR